MGEVMLMTEPHDGHGPDVSCPGCPHGAVGSGVVLTEAERDIAAEFDRIRDEHRIESMQAGCACGAVMVVVYDDEGQALFNPLIRHHHEEFAKAAAARVERALAEQRARIAARISGLQARVAWQQQPVLRALQDAIDLARSYRQDPTDG